MTGTRRPPGSRPNQNYFDYINSQRNNPNNPNWTGYNSGPIKPSSGAGWTTPTGGYTGGTPQNPGAAGALGMTDPGGFYNSTLSPELSMFPAIRPPYQSGIQSPENYMPYTDNMTQYGMNQAMGSAPDFRDFTKQTGAPGVSFGPGQYHRALAGFAGAQGSAAMNAARIPLQHHMANESARLQGEQAAAQEQLGQSNLWNNYNRIRDQQQNYTLNPVLQAMSGMYGGLFDGLFGSMMLGA